MSSTFSSGAGWDTSSGCSPAQVSQLEMSALGDHLVHCGALRGPLNALVTYASSLQSLLAAHSVTAMVLITLLAGTISLVR